MVAKFSWAIVGGRVDQVSQDAWSTCPPTWPNQILLPSQVVANGGSRAVGCTEQCLRRHAWHCAVSYVPVIYGYVGKPIAGGNLRTRPGRRGHGRAEQLAGSSRTRTILLSMFSGDPRVFLKASGGFVNLSIEVGRVLE
jgi:hypothetical protein